MIGRSLPFLILCFEGENLFRRRKEARCPTSWFGTGFSQALLEPYETRAKPGTNGIAADQMFAVSCLARSQSSLIEARNERDKNVPQGRRKEINYFDL